MLNWKKKINLSSILFAEIWIRTIIWYFRYIVLMAKFRDNRKRPNLMHKGYKKNDSPARIKKKKSNVFTFLDSAWLYPSKLRVIIKQEFSITQVNLTVASSSKSVRGAECFAIGKTAKSVWSPTVIKWGSHHLRVSLFIFLFGSKILSSPEVHSVWLSVRDGKPEKTFIISRRQGEIWGKLALRHQYLPCCETQ